ncbi:hypothetical protein NXF25_010380 [Crotalus adamanteus]|uniref:Uncharacterized protein n=1 Tax=Crotalus adamanteus TaxID=8729 RepID=A0AAW1BIZ5_CROAD
MNNVNGLAHQFTSSEIPLSPYMLNRLEDLNGRWKLLQVIMYSLRTINTVRMMIWIFWRLLIL